MKPGVLFNRYPPLFKTYPLALLLPVCQYIDMKCIYCMNNTKVTNSRSRSLNSSIWRRRECISCVAQFSTEELPNLNSTIAVLLPNNRIEPFSRDKLFLSIHKALGHRIDSVNNASDITSTVISKIVRGKNMKNASVEVNIIAKTTFQVLRRFDSLSANTYKAYHQDSLN